MTAEVVFIISCAVIAYTYAGYPALAYVLSRIFGRPARRADITPKVSVIIAARNEERDIAAKIENALALDYPKEKLEIIVASDSSTDRTDEIVRSYESRGVLLHRQTVRLGKSAAQNQAVRVSSGEILVFSDATTKWHADSVQRIVRSFADPEVGCVAGQLLYADPTASAVGRGCSAYWSWEKQIRQSESRLGSLIGVSGCLYAVRRSCHRRLAGDMIDDFVIASEIHLQGLRTVYEPEALAIEHTNRRAVEEFRMRVRVIEQTMSAFHRYRWLLSLRQRMFAFQLISHKVLRYTIPLFLMTAYASNFLVATKDRLYAVTFSGMTLFYLAALAGWVLSRLWRPIGLLTIPYYFALANLASVVAFVKFLRGDSRVVWEPVRDAIGQNLERS